MESVGYLAPLAFVLALGAWARASALKREIDRLRQELSELSQQTTGNP